MPQSTLFISAPDESRIRSGQGLWPCQRFTLDRQVIRVPDAGGGAAQGGVSNDFVPEFDGQSGCSGYTQCERSKRISR